MCAKTAVTQQLASTHDLLTHTPKFRTHLPLQIHLQDLQSFQRARKLGILKPNHFHKLSLYKSNLKGRYLPLNTILPLAKAKHLKAFQYKSHEEPFGDSSSTFHKLFPISSINLRKLCIELNYSYRQLNCSTLPSLTRVITFAQTLRELYLRVRSNKRPSVKDIANDQELLGILQGLNKLVYLESLHVELRDCQKISDQGIEAFSNAFNKLAQLKEFSFCMIQNSMITDDVIARILNSMWRLSELVTLNVDLTGSYQIGNTSMNVLAEALSRLPHLKKLCLRLDGCQMDLNSLTRVLEVIGKLTQLEELEISLGAKRKGKLESSYTVPNPNDEASSGSNFKREDQRGVEQKKTMRDNLPLGKTLASKTRLKKLKLSLHESWANGDELIWDLAWAIPQLRRLVELSVRIHSGNWSEIVNDTNIKMLCKAISRLGRSLEVLHLDVQWSKAATDNGMVSLAESLTLLEGLKDLYLNFGEWNRITDHGIASLAKGLSHLKKLEKLALRLNGVYNVGDEGVKRISEGLQNLSGLNLLHLNLERCSMITEEALVKIGRVLGMLSDFQELCIDLEGCEQFRKIAQSEMFSNQLGDQSVWFEISCVRLVLRHLNRMGTEGSVSGDWNVQKPSEMGTDSPEFSRGVLF